VSTVSLVELAALADKQLCGPRKKYPSNWILNGAIILNAGNLADLEWAIMLSRRTGYPERGLSHRAKETTSSGCALADGKLNGIGGERT
jgi:hypothetical protein